jgi:hypothetical protein
MGKRRVLASVLAGLVTVGLALAPSATAYKIPGKPGSAGGPPTKAKGGSGTSKGGANKIATGAAGFTGSELAAKGKITVKVHVPKAGKLSGKMTARTTKLGSGSATAHKAGTVNLTITFTSAGKAYLNAHNGQAIKVKVTCVFKPKKGKAQTSAATVTLDP